MKNKAIGKEPAVVTTPAKGRKIWGLVSQAAEIVTQFNQEVPVDQFRRDGESHQDASRRQLKVGVLGLGRAAIQALAAKRQEAREAGGDEQPGVGVVEVAAAVMTGSSVPPSRPTVVRQGVSAVLTVAAGLKNHLQAEGPKEGEKAQKAPPSDG